MEKGEIAHFEQFHLFPQCFPKTFSFDVLKWVYVEEKVKYHRILDLDAFDTRFVYICTLPVIQYKTPVTIQADTCRRNIANTPVAAAATRSIRLTIKQEAAEFCIPENKMDMQSRV